MSDFKTSLHILSYGSDKQISFITVTCICRLIHLNWVTAMLGVLTLPLAVISAFWDMLTIVLTSSLGNSGPIVGYCTDVLWGG